MLLITLLEPDVIAFRPCFLHLQCQIFRNPFPEVHLSLRSRSPVKPCFPNLSSNSPLPNSLNGMLTHSGFTAKVWTLWKGLDHVEFLISKHFVTAEAFCSNDSMNSLTEFAICSLPNSPGELARRGYLERVRPANSVLCRIYTCPSQSKFHKSECLDDSVVTRSLLIPKRTPSNPRPYHHAPSLFT